MATGGVVTADSTFGISPGSDLLAAAPQEFVAIVNKPGYQSSSPTLKAVVPSDGVYRARAYARDRDWTAIPVLLSAWGPGWGRIALGLGGWAGDASWFAPFYYRDAASDRTISPLYASGRGCAAVPPHGAST